MVQSSATTVAEYLRTVDAVRLPAVKRFRELCREHVQGWEERLKDVDTGKGCVRYRTPESIDFGVVADMLKHIRASNRAQ